MAKKHAPQASSPTTTNQPAAAPAVPRLTVKTRSKASRIATNHNPVRG